MAINLLDKKKQDSDQSQQTKDNSEFDRMMNPKNYAKSIKPWERNNAKNKQQSLKNQLANKAIDAGIDKAGQALAAETAGASIAAAEALKLAKKHKREALMLLVTIIVIAISPLLFVFWLIMGQGGTATTTQQCGGSVGQQTAGGELSTDEYKAIYGNSPAEVEANLVSIDFQGKQVKVHKKVQAVFEQVNREITAANTGYQFRSVGTYAWREKNGSSTGGLSTHSFGITIDINPDTNPYHTSDAHDIPPQVAEIFKKNGFAWGGDWQPKHDWMHFQYEGVVGPETGTAVASGAGALGAAGTQSNTTGTGCPPASTNSGGTTLDYLPPSDNNCGGKYNLTSSLGRNFGDPQCNFDKNQLYLGLKIADPANADVWFNKVIPCESSFNPNAHAGPQTGTPDAAGAWGLFQMGSANPPGSPPPAPGKNGPNDRGDVNWQVQMTNATAYGQKIGDLGRYWACARK